MPTGFLSVASIDAAGPQGGAPARILTSVFVTSNVTCNDPFYL